MEAPERFLVCLRGAPIGEVDLTDGDLVIADLEPKPAYEAIRADVRLASQDAWKAGFLGALKSRMTADVLAPVGELSFELRDLTGSAVHADFVNVIARKDAAQPSVVVVSRRRANAAVASILSRTPRADRPGQRGDA